MNTPRKSPARYQPRRFALPAVLAVSIFLHLALLGLPLSFPDHSARPAAYPIELIREPAPKFDFSPVLPESREDVLAQPVPAPLPAPARSSPTEAVAETDAAAETLPPATRLQDLVIGTARKLGTEEEAPSERTSMRYAAIPKLPGQTGWLNEHVGTVPRSVDRWQDSDGSMNTRTVLASGHAICTRTRAPTIQEFFNPWMSAAVPMVRLCGRERPRTVDRTDPWQRIPESRRADD